MIPYNKHLISGTVHATNIIHVLSLHLKGDIVLQLNTLSKEHVLY